MAPPECLKLCGSRLISRAEATSSYGSRTRHSPTAVEVAGRGPKLPFAIQAWGDPKILGRSSYVMIQHIDSHILVAFWSAPP